jgi:hypothetical protein
MTTISDEYRAQQVELHTNPNYGVASVSFAPLVNQLIKLNQFVSLHDYGAGKRRLREHIDVIEYTASDPAFPEYGPPRVADLTTCIDVLEHVEPSCLDAVLDDLQTITKVGFFTVHTGPAMKFLSDGRNAHLIQNPARWWLPKFCERWDILNVSPTQGGFYVIVRVLAESRPDTAR